ncbi:MAG: hypothetical protein U1C55_12070, partial [Smithellaceae bacterium]|nr:hypothetical protein [Smithellaceae bacterium]
RVKTAKTSLGLSKGAEKDMFWGTDGRAPSRPLEYCKKRAQGQAIFVLTRPLKTESLHTFSLS